MLRGACVAPTVKPRHKPDPADIRKTVACSLIRPTTSTAGLLLA